MRHDDERGGRRVGSRLETVGVGEDGVDEGVDVCRASRSSELPLSYTVRTMRNRQGPTALGKRAAAVPGEDEEGRALRLEARQEYQRAPSALREDHEDSGSMLVCALTSRGNEIRPLGSAGADSPTMGALATPLSELGRTERISVKGNMLC